jgi:riboflavin synthase
MFTGIVQAIGAIRSLRPVEVAWSDGSLPDGGDRSGLRLTVAYGDLDATDVAIGDSIAINGACMTVVALDDTGFEVDVSRESLHRTARLDTPGPVNLEKAMRASDRLGGHMVSGHVDARATVTRIEPVGESWTLAVLLPVMLAAYVHEKGSITIDGVSLTVNSVQDGRDGCEIAVNLIPHTWQATTLHLRKVGDAVNIEVDQLAKQVARILERMQPAG